jgi:hypothetical protein
LQLAVLVGLLAAACNLPGQLASNNATPTEPPVTPSATYTLAPTFTSTPIQPPTPSATHAPIPTETLTPLPPLAPVVALSPTLDPLLTVLTATPTETATPQPTPEGPKAFTKEELDQLVAHMCPRRQACFMSPISGSTVNGVVEFRGGAMRPGFNFYKLEFRAEGTSDWVLIDTGQRAVRLGTLGFWNTADFPNGVYWVRLRVVDQNGNYWPEEPELKLVVENKPNTPTRDPFEGLRYNPTATGGAQ